MVRGFGFAVLLVVASLPRPVLAGPASLHGSLARSVQESVATFDEASCPFELPGGVDEGTGVECGYLTVPEFHDEPEGDTIELAVAIFRSPATPPAEEPLVFLLGGPGQEVEGTLVLFSESLINYLPLLEERDVVVLEQRGIGYSEPSLACPFDDVAGADPEVTWTELEDPMAAVVECGAELRATGIDLEAFDTRENAADVNDLRAALGYDRVDLYGISYGSRLALTVMRDYPEAVRSAILASPLPLQTNIAAGVVISFDRAMKRLFAACDDDPSCAAKHPELQETFSEAVEGLDANPIPVTVTDVLTGDAIDAVIDGQTFVSLVYLSLFVGLFLLPMVPSTIEAAANGDTGPLELLLSFGSALTIGVSYGANLVYQCNDEFSFTDAEEVTRLIEQADVLPELASGAFVGAFEAFPICDALGLDPARQAENDAVKSDVPTLIVAGEYDPITPPEYGEQIAEVLPNSYLVVLPGLGHDPISTGGACAMSIATAFLDDPASEPDTDCVEDMGLRFVG